MNWKSIKEWFVAEHPPIDPGDVVCTVDGVEEEKAQEGKSRKASSDPSPYAHRCLVVVVVVFRSLVRIA